MGQLLFWLPMVVGIGVLALGVVSYSESGDAWRNAGARFALGSYGMLLGILFSLVFFSEDARGNDVFLNNALVAPQFWVFGSIILILSLAGFGLNRWVVLLLGVANPVLGLSLFSMMTLNTPQLLIPLLVLDTAALIVLGIILARRQQCWQIPAQGVLLGVGGLVAASLVYHFLGTYYRNGYGRVIGPPYLEGNVAMICLGLGLTIFLVERAWSKGRTLQRAA